MIEEREGGRLGTLGIEKFAADYLELELGGKLTRTLK